SALTGANLFMASVFDNAFGDTASQEGTPLGHARHDGAWSSAQAPETAAARPLQMTAFERHWLVWTAGYG
ncbi:hypothetical protein, partial [Citrobacter freundii]|uniref:hypothetical protein n=1 Tax=Citrobacter freundii TaxID=546 RepID=UPI0013D7CFCA